MRGIVISLAVLGLSLSACGNGEQDGKAAEAPAGPRLVLKASDTTDWQDVSAEIATVDQAQVVARIPGILSSLAVREGDRVTKGQVIGRIVDSQLGHQAEAWRAQAVQAQAELARVRFLHENGVYADARLQQAEAAASTAKAHYAAASAVTGQGAVVAPATGRVLRADIPAGAPVAPGMAIAVITAGPVVVRLEMAETLADKVRVGARVTADGGKTGTITRIYPAVTAGQVMADASIAGIDDRLIGRRVAARVETGTRKALLVPAGYVTRRYGIDYATVLMPDGGAAQVPVQTTAAGAGTVEILSGVVAGDTLIGPDAGAAGK